LQAKNSSRTKIFEEKANVVMYIIPKQKNPVTSTQAEFSVTSELLPGLQPIYFQNDLYGLAASWQTGQVKIIGLPHMRRSIDNEAMANASIPEHNANRQFAIGPLFPSDVTKEEITARVVEWVKYGFTFLAPLMTSKDPVSTLNMLKPSTQLEQDIVTCLRGVLK
jgi:hypothetical protein